MKLCGMHYSTLDDITVSTPEIRTPHCNQDMIFLARGCPDQRGSTLVFGVRSDGIVYNSIATYIDCSILKVNSWSLTIVLQTICTH